MRFFGGTCAALISHIVKGFSLYDDLTPLELDDGRDSESLYFMRVIFLWVCVIFTSYLLFSCCCMCYLTGIDGGNIVDVRRARDQFKRIPFGNLAFREGMECAICMESFREIDRVVKLRCHETHLYHRSCIVEWVRSGARDCPLCRQPISQN